MRLFETEEDRKKELFTIKKFIELNNLDLVPMKLPQLGLDFMLTKDGVTKAFVEVKNFNTRFRTYDTVVVAVKKYNKMQAYNWMAPTYFIVNFANKDIAWINVDNIKGETKWFERTNQRKGNANDSENMIFVPKELFKTIKL